MTMPLNLELVKQFIIEFNSGSRSPLLTQFFINAINPLLEALDEDIIDANVHTIARINFLSDALYLEVSTDPTYNQAVIIPLSIFENDDVVDAAKKLTLTNKLTALNTEKNKLRSKLSEITYEINIINVALGNSNEYQLPLTLKDDRSKLSDIAVNHIIFENDQVLLCKGVYADDKEDISEMLCIDKQSNLVRNLNYMHYSLDTSKKK